ncbi:MAG: glutamate-5-semialdehyde dehydrogenase [Acidimicrobiales bacterium]|nr:glutamate-5-semialdehyde dehydrogenase [Acidimicrobiales bacterium]
MTATPTPIPELAARAKDASRALAVASTAEKDAALHAAADLLVANAEPIIEANAIDVARAEAEGMAPPLVDRLRLDPSRIDGMAGGLRQVASLADPIGAITDGWVRPNGLRIEKVRVPLGVVGIIYESRPNVTSDAFGLCLKSGNAAFLRGSSSAIDSNLAISAVLRDAVAKAGLPEDALIVVDDPRREAAVEFMQQRGFVDCLIPRGGPALIQSILDNATVPYVIDGAGNCHVYVDASADLDMAREILFNAKTHRTGVCNAAESLVVHADIAAEFLPSAIATLEGVELVGDAAAQAIDPSIGEATEADFAEEYLDMKMSVKVVADLDEAIAHVNDTSTGHSEAIATSDIDAADRFTREVDAAAVLVNASTRFVDGEEFGFGAEIGISTQKLHARGPMGLEQLTTEKFVVRGTGQVRG